MNTIGENFNITNYICSTLSATSAVAGWVDATDFSQALATYTRTAGTANLTAFRIDVCDTLSAGVATSDTATVKSAVLTNNPNAVGDYVPLEVTESEIRAAADAAGLVGKYISGVLIEPDGTGVSVVTLIGRSKRPHLSLTSAYIQ